MVALAGRRVEKVFNNQAIPVNAVKAWAYLQYPPAQNQYMQEKHLGELIFSWIHVGPVFTLAQIQENIFEELFLKYVFTPSQTCIPTLAPSVCMDTVAVFTHPWCQYIKHILGKLISVRIHAAHVFAPARTQKIFLGNYLCIGFVPGGKSRKLRYWPPYAHPTMRSTISVVWSYCNMDKWDVLKGGWGRSLSAGVLWDIV